MMTSVSVDLSRSRLVLATVFCLLVLPAVAMAQFTIPRLGFSAAPDARVDSVEVAMGDVFTLYVSMYGFEEGMPIGQDFSSISWVVLAVCCGATLNVMDVQYNPDFIVTGAPYEGVLAQPVSGCVDEDVLHFATLTVSLDAPKPGEYLMVAGPFMNSTDCNGEQPIVMDLPIRVLVDSGATPNDDQSWGALKSLYR